MYHQSCMKLGAPLAEDEELICECCRYGTATHQHRGLVVVTWQPRWEPASVLDHDTEIAPYQAGKIARESRPPPPAPRPDAHLHMLQQQGVHGPNKYINALTDAARQKIHIEHQPINPHTDIVPCNQYKIEVRTVQRWLPRAGDRPAGTIAYKAACIYGPDGRCVQQVPPVRLHALHKNYCQVREQRPDLCQRLGCSTFAEEMYKMAMRYKKETASNADSSGKHTWRAPEEIIDVQRKHLGLQHHRLSTPLTYHTHMKHFWSTYERDQLLGASWQPYAYQWRGYSQCSPVMEYAI